MKSFAVASVLLAAVAVAQPHGHQHRRHHHQQQHEKRAVVTEVEWVIETLYVTKLVDSTTTVWVTPGSEAEATGTTDEAKFIETPQPKKEKATTTSTSTTTSTTSTSIYVAPKPTTTSTTSTSVYVAPEETTTSSTSVYVAPKETSTSVEEQQPTTSEVYVVPTTTKVYVAPTTSEAPAATTSASSGGGSGSGSNYSGDITYYDLGTNACGGSAAGEDYTSNIVALPKGMMGGDGPTYSTNPYCGKSITITANGKSIEGIVQDKCMGCVGGSIDVSMKIFSYLFDGLDKGRGECEWSFN